MRLPTSHRSHTSQTLSTPLRLNFSIDFGVLLREVDGQCYISSSVTYQTFAIIYLLLGVFTIVQLVKQAMSFEAVRQANLVFLQHILIACVRYPFECDMLSVLRDLSRVLGFPAIFHGQCLSTASPLFLPCLGYLSFGSS